MKKFFKIYENEMRSEFIGPNIRVVKNQNKYHFGQSNLEIPFVYRGYFRNIFKMESFLKYIRLENGTYVGPPI